LHETTASCAKSGLCLISPLAHVAQRNMDKTKSKDHNASESRPPPDVDDDVFGSPLLSVEPAVFAGGWKSHTVLQCAKSLSVGDDVKPLVVPQSTF